METTFNEKEQTLTIVIDCNTIDPPPSNAYHVVDGKKVVDPATQGKSLSMITTHGNQSIALTVKGKAVTVSLGINGYVSNPDAGKPRT